MTIKDQHRREIPYKERRSSYKELMEKHGESSKKELQKLHRENCLTKWGSSSSSECNAIAETINRYNSPFLTGC